jgi:hypothetical protein
MTEQGNRFRNSIARGKYQLLRKHHILGERRINFNDLVEFCPIVHEAIDVQGWEPLVACAVPACLDIVWELYVNMYEVHEDSFKTYLRGKDLYIDAEVIDTFCGVPHFPYSPYPYTVGTVPSWTELCSCFSNDAHPEWNDSAYHIRYLSKGRRMLSQIMTQNLWPISSYALISYPRACLLYALCNFIPVDFRKLVVVAMQEVHYVTIPEYSIPCAGLITLFTASSQVHPEPGELLVAPMRPFDKVTMHSSSANIIPSPLDVPNDIDET